MCNKILNWLAFVLNNAPESITIEVAGDDEVLPEDNAAVDDALSDSENIEENTEIINNDAHIDTEPVIATGINNNMVILLDNGHAKSTCGKRSPKKEDGTQFFEYEFNREIVKRLASMLESAGIKYHILVPEVDEDISLSTRAARANKYCDMYGAGNCLFISVHANAAGNGGWMNGRGWCVYTTKGVTKSDAIATVFWEEAQKLLEPLGQKMRKDMSDGDPDWEENFTVIYKARCPAILTENLFYDNKEDLAFLETDWGKEIIARLHFNAILRLLQK